MSDTPTGDEDDLSEQSSETDVAATPVTSPYKVLGELDADDGVGVLGQNDADSGTPVGVQGAVPNNPAGFGLATPDDARVEGAIDTAETDFVVEAGRTATSDASNVILGHASNRATSGVVGGVVGGGGYDDGSTYLPNQVVGDYGTITGGRNNRVGASGSVDAFFATVGGGRGNTASGGDATVGGGDSNTASGGDATVGGGDSNTASGLDATVGGGDSNTASAIGATVGGGGGGIAKEQWATVGGGIRNTADGVGATVGGGNANRTGKSGTSKGFYATVPGGRQNVARADYSFAAGRRAEALAEGAFVRGDNNTATSGAEYSTISGGTSNAVTGSQATVGGGLKNTASAAEATVSGGESNTASGGNATVGGGDNNTASGLESTVGGGLDNTANATEATVGGGERNVARGVRATVGGGQNNTANATESTVGGGDNNRTGKSGTTKGFAATVPGGKNAVAQGDYSFAAGLNAEALARGAFVWGDSDSAQTVQSSTQDEVVFQAGGGVTMWSTSDFNSKVELKPGDSSWTAGSSRAIKSAVDPVDPTDVLAAVEDLTVSTWEYDSRQGVTHMGPMAEDFHDAFGLGEDPERISTVDADGVALAAIQGLAERLDEASEELAEKDDRIDELRRENGELREANEALRDRLAAVEAHIGLDDAAPSPGDE